jgi:hypothetical protein
MLVQRCVCAGAYVCFFRLTYVYVHLLLLCRAMCSIEQEQLPGGRRVVMMATPSALYIAAGGPGLAGLFSRCGTTAVCCRYA